ncbi:ATP-binding protein, partial [Eubacteriales bacterium OttesenSCG-928-N13]|nr:ATP-binding protein [Eubacteriales bacterium OttesenSCG-928-N13]
MTHSQRSWTVLLLCGASGTGKSYLANQLARHEQVNVLGIDDIGLALKAVTTADVLPALHSGADWLEIGVARNVDWLLRVGKELMPALRAIIKDHLQSGDPIIIEGDFLDMDLAHMFPAPQVKTLVVCEPSLDQIVQNYLAREGGDLQQYRAEISSAFSKHLADLCETRCIPCIEARPWDTALQRA